MTEAQLRDIWEKTNGHCHFVAIRSVCENAVTDASEPMDVGKSIMSSNETKAA